MSFDESLLTPFVEGGLVPGAKDTWVRGVNLNWLGQRSLRLLAGVVAFEGRPPLSFGCDLLFRRLAARC